MKKIFPCTVFSDSRLEEAKVPEIILIYEQAVDKHSYADNEKQLLNELMKIIWFSNPGYEDVLASRDSVEVLYYELSEAYQFFRNPSKKIVEVMSITKGNPLEEYPCVLSHLQAGETAPFSILMDFLREEVALYQNGDAAFMINAYETYENYKEVIQGTRRLQLLKDKERQRPIIGKHPEMNQFLLFREESDEEKESSKLRKWLEEWTPPKIVDYLNQQHIVGQMSAKITAAMAAYTHINQLAHPDVNHRKPHCIFYGPTGSGKTLIWETLAKILPVKFNIVDSSQLTPAGYQGIETSDVILSIFKYNRKRGTIVFVDEFDKLCLNDISSDKRTQGQTQSNFLKILEGSILTIGKHTVDTRDSLFVFAGAFHEIVQEKPEKSKIGFIQESEQTPLMHCVPDKEFIEKYHMMPELIERIEYRTYCKKLKMEEYLEVCKSPNGPVENLKKVYEPLGVDLTFEESVYYELAKYAAEAENFGARLLYRTLAQAIVETCYQAMCLGQGPKEVFIRYDDIRDYFHT